MITRYSKMHRTDKYSQHSSIIWPVSVNGWVFVYELNWLWVRIPLQSLKLQIWHLLWALMINLCRILIVVCSTICYSLKKKQYLIQCFLQTSDVFFHQFSAQLINPFASMKMDLKISSIPAWLTKFSKY